MRKKANRNKRRNDETKNRRNKSKKKGKEVNKKGRGGKVLPVRSMKACRGSRGIAPLILKLGTRRR